MKEEEIRIGKVFDKYLELVKEDVRKFFDPHASEEVKCPACDSDDFGEEFEKLGFKYVNCRSCSTLFVNPRPGLKALRQFYSESNSTTFWVNEFFKPVAENRRKKIFRPRAEYVKSMLGAKETPLIGDIGTGYGLFLDELRKMVPKGNYVAIEPSSEMAGICESLGFEACCSFLEDIHGMEGRFDLLTAFELIEHLNEPLLFLSKAKAMLKPGGYFMATTLNGKGFDIQILWEKSKSVTPPHHLNFFNVSSMTHLMERAGFQVLETSTPGELDWDIVEGMSTNHGTDVGRFWKLVADEGSERCKVGLQKWISHNNLSSHMRILARKPE